VKLYDDTYGLKLADEAKIHEKPVFFHGFKPRSGAQDGPKCPQDRPKMAPRSPKIAPRWPQDGPRWPQDGPRGPKNRYDTIFDVMNDIKIADEAKMS
jgi:hypothetical protein